MFQSYAYVDQRMHISKRPWVLGHFGPLNTISHYSFNQIFRADWWIVPFCSYYLDYCVMLWSNFFLPMSPNIRCLALRSPWNIEWSCPILRPPQIYGVYFLIFFGQYIESKALCSYLEHFVFDWSTTYPNSSYLLFSF